MHAALFLVSFEADKNLAVIKDVEASVDDAAALQVCQVLRHDSIPVA